MADHAEVHAKKLFDAWTRDHRVEVLHDDGLYRHLHITAPGSLDWFDIITWPGRLTIDGGHGTWTFARTEDMFQFFRATAPGRINASYWAEKLQCGAGSGREPAKTYSEAVYVKHVVEAVDEWVQDADLSLDSKIALYREVYSELLDADDWSYPGHHNVSAHQAVAEFSCRVRTGPPAEETNAERLLGAEPRYATFEFHDTWEWDLKGYDFHFLWSCFALRWGIEQYDQMKKAEAAA